MGINSTNAIDETPLDCLRFFITCYTLQKHIDKNKILYLFSGIMMQMKLEELYIGYF